MSRGLKAAAVAVALAVVIVASAVLALRSDWFRESVHRRVVAELERATGGRVEISAFTFTWRPLRAEVAGLVIHGRESPPADPLFTARAVRIGLGVTSFLRRKVEIISIDVEEPRVNVIVRAGGTTNLPEPKLPRGNAVGTILDLAIGSFSARNGAFQFGGQKIAFDVRGENLLTRFVFDSRRKLYTGDLTARALVVQSGKLPAIPADVSLHGITAGRNGLDIASAEIAVEGSRAVFTGLRYDARATPLELTARLEATLVPGRTLKLPMFTSGTVEIRGGLRFRNAGDYSIKGDANFSGITVAQGKLKAAGIRGSATFDVGPDKIALGGVSISAQGGTFTGSGEVVAYRDYRVKGMLKGFPAVFEAWSGVVSGTVEADGRIGGEPRRAVAKLQIAPGGAGIHASGAIDATYDGRGRTLTLGDSFLTAGSTKVAFSGVLGTAVKVRLESSNLDDALPLVAGLPVRLHSGSALVAGVLAGKIDAPSFSGRVTMTNYEFAGEMFARFSADATMDESSLAVRNADVIRRGAKARGEGRISLTRWRPEPASALSATGTFAGFDAAEILPDLSFLASGRARISGTHSDPRIFIEASARNATVFGESLDGLEARIEYSKQAIELRSAELQAGASRVDVAASYAHDGALAFRISSNRMAVERSQALSKLRPGVSGTLEISATGTGIWRDGKGPFLLTDLTATAAARDLRMDNKPAGNVSLTAKSVRERGATDLLVSLESDFLNANLRGAGRWTFADKYPGSFELNFSTVPLKRVQEWFAPASTTTLEGSAEGTLRVSGPALEWKDWTASLEIPKLEFSSPGSEATRVQLRNIRPVRLSLAKSIVSVESALLAGPSTNLAVSGKMSLLESNPLDLRVTGSTELAAIQSYYRDVIASGTAELQASVRGSFAQPRASGRLEIKDASVNVADLPNGLSKANGVILFDGSRATVQSLTGETGGGKVALTGFVGFGGEEIVYRLQGTGTQIRLRYPEGVSTTVNAALSLTGARKRSLLSGEITIVRTGFNPRTDFSSLLAKSAEPVKTASARTGPLAGMDLDVRIETSPDISVESALAQDIQVEAGLRLRGTVYNPALLGRIAITQGELNFFGTKYAINQGTITFSNPVKVEPVFDVDVETRVRGIDVILTLSGPIDKLNITHRSDPPLEFGEVVALLATGRAPTTDPALAATQARRPQSFSQVGADAILGQAISGPVSDRLQRFFGVSKLKIDPSLTGVENNPQARLTVEQQITRNLAFTYITNLTRSNPQVVRVEWTLNKEWSAVAVREENGLFGLDFLYKKRF
ncbi:MAG: translocation/assembly module TamB [Bryobacterales bacterium]|nr:translocation/assembly module TamB [Bryobacterales bacterium]